MARVAIEQARLPRGRIARPTGRRRPWRQERKVYGNALLLRRRAEVDRDERREREAEAEYKYESAASSTTPIAITCVRVRPTRQPNDEAAEERCR